MKKPLIEYKKNYHSQNGEDGIIEEILERLGIFNEAREKWCVEFGAWDGVHLSNTYRLIKDKGFHSVLIEGDEVKHKELCKNISAEKSDNICAFVDIKGDNTLDSILSRTRIPQDFDFISIDIDGCDYYIWETLNLYSPKMVCIEYNPSIPIEVDFKQPPDFSVKWGSSAKAIDNLALRKGYNIVAVTDANLLYVRKDLVGKVIDNTDLKIEEIFTRENKIFIFVGFDGTILSNAKRIDVPWLRVSFKMSSFQKVPKILRKYRLDYGLGRKLLYSIWSRFQDGRPKSAKLRRKKSRKRNRIQLAGNSRGRR